VLDGDEVIYIDKVDSSEPIQAYSHVGGRAPAHCVATGKALLSCRSNAFLNDLATRLKPYSEHTITDPARFLAEMEQIRKQGFALNLGEWREGVWGVAALIRDARGEVAGAVGISGPSFRIKERNIDNYVGPVMAAAEDISSRLGYRKNLLVRST
jgi:DNA-binding IclR family transcriptional regulator